MNTLHRFLFVLLFAVPALAASAAQVRLTWTGNNPPGSVTYVVYQEQADDTWKEIATTPDETYVLTNLTPGVYTFVVTARNLWGESGPSNEASSPPPANAPGNLRVTVTVTVSVTRHHGKRGRHVVVVTQSVDRNDS